MAGFCEHVNELPVFIEFGEIFYILSSGRVLGITVEEERTRRVMQTSLGER